jgi:hypothetical protein
MLALGQNPLNEPPRSHPLSPLPGCSIRGIFGDVEHFGTQSFHELI